MFRGRRLVSKATLHSRYSRHQTYQMYAVASTPTTKIAVRCGRNTSDQHDPIAMPIKSTASIKMPTCHHVRVNVLNMVIH